ncbi:hypothetical protein [Haloarchaeobius sp. DFWS5]|uniref:hypothetical protein n=1 Tax=Haloarchaeobius sp. DFWS5 TaxID=3446114 RepID=UPI003EBA80AB
MDRTRFDCDSPGVPTMEMGSHHLVRDWTTIRRRSRAGRPPVRWLYLSTATGGG